MKAKVIKTGEVIEVHQKTTTGWASETLDKIRFFEDSELDFNFEDWEVFRREAAKDFAVALVSSGSELNSKTIVYAIGMADELIRQLKD